MFRLLFANTKTNEMLYLFEYLIILQCIENLGLNSLAFIHDHRSSTSKKDGISFGTKIYFVLLQRYQSDSTIWLQNTFGKFP